MRKTSILLAVAVAASLAAPAAIPLAARADDAAATATQQPADTGAGTGGEGGTGALAGDDALASEASSSEYQSAQNTANTDATPDETGSQSAGAQVETLAAPLLSYNAHVANRGWLDAVDEGQAAGTTGQNLPMEAFEAALYWEGHNAGIRMRSAGADSVWGEWQTKVSGTTGRGLALHAIAVELTGDIANSYDIYYRVHIANEGWLDWTKNGEGAGSLGTANAIQAYEMVLVEKGGAAPGPTTRPFYTGEEQLGGSWFTMGAGDWSYAAKGSGMTLGRAGGAPLQAVRLIMKGHYTPGALEYAVDRAGAGWQQGWDADGGFSGALNHDPVKAVKIRLTGELDSAYTLWYRVCLSRDGWLGWTQGGEAAGTDDPAQYVCAVQVARVEKGQAAPGETGGAYKDVDAGLGVGYQAHVTNDGWLTPVYDGANGGTTGRGLSLQALRVWLEGDEDAVAGSSIETRAHVTNIGWQNWTGSSSFAGTTGRNLSIQAVQLRLTGALAQDYDIYYRVHAANLGWLGWAKNGESAGTTGLNYQAESMQIELVRKGEAGPASSTPALVDMPGISMTAHVQDAGWTAAVGNGGVLGIAGGGKRIEAFTASASSELSGGIVSSAHVQDIGWTAWSQNGQICGTTGRGLRIEAVKLKLTGELERYFDVWYRVYAQQWGWLGWTKNGEAAGTGKRSLRAEAVQVVVKPKGSAAPGSTYRPYTEQQALSGHQLTMYNLAQGYSSPTPWLILVDTANTRVAVFNGQKGSWNLQKYFLCTDGAPWTPTVRGVFSVGVKGYVFGHGYSCYYYTQFYGDYLFHSTLYREGTFIHKDNRLGMHLSAGCVRLDISNAKWIYDNIPSRSTVVVY